MQVGNAGDPNKHGLKEYLLPQSSQSLGTTSLQSGLDSSH